MKMLWITGVALLLDQVSKWLVMEQMVLGESVSVLGSVFKLTYIHNPGAVFGLRLGGPYAHLALAGGALVLVGVLLWQLPKNELLGAVGLTLVLGGAIGNMIDRVRFGVVVDFLDVGFGDLRWYVFNLADTWVTVGTGLLIIAYGWMRQNGEDAHGNGDSSRA